MSAAALALGAGEALGAAFALQEQNASGLGHAYAGGAGGTAGDAVSSSGGNGGATTFGSPAVLTAPGQSSGSIRKRYSRAFSSSTAGTSQSCGSVG